MRSIWGLIAAAVAAPAIGQIASPAPVVLATPDSGRLAAARLVIDQIFPPGTYRRMMQGTMDQVLGGMTKQMLDLPVRDLARMGGMPEAKLAQLKPATMRQMMAIFDPAFDRRMQITMKIMMDGMIDLMDKFEPDVREGLAAAYATHFSPDQLADLHRLFATPTGSLYARQSMTLMTDPQIMAKMQAIMPRLMAMMPDILKKVQAATATLPKPRKADDLTPAEKEQMQTLLGAPEAK